MSKPAPAKSCPICGRPSVPASTPFCSSRCADVDLNRWLSGVYALPASEADDAEETDPTAGETLPERKT